MRVASAPLLVCLLGLLVAAGCASTVPKSPDADVAGGADAAASIVDAELGPDACVPTAETCNDADDDCDGASDEDFADLGDPCMAGAGACIHTGMRVCDLAGTGTRCSAEPGPGGTELCNTFDDDCDGMTDEGFGLGAMCDGADSDQCLEGVIGCAGDGTAACGDATASSTEACNTSDDDCDGMTDEGFALGAGCDGADGDACAEGVTICAGDGTTTCGDVTGTTTERCNGVDDDCQNGVDDGFPVGQACTAGVGACARPGSYVCDASGNTAVGNASPGTPTAETCGDGLDQDCSGADVSCPVNDRPAGAVDISAGGTFTVDLGAANNDQNFTGTSCGSTGGRDVFYTFTLPAAEVVYLDTFGSNFDTTLRVFAGSCTALGALASCFDDACSVTQTQGALSLAAGTYCLVADQYSSAQTLGALTLRLTRGGRAGTAVGTGTGTVSGNSCSGTNASTPSCQSSSTAQDTGHYFLACPGVTRTVTANTCTGTTFDSVISLRAGHASSGATLACNDDATGCGTSNRQSSFTGASAVGPGLFWLQVDGYLSNCGAYTLGYTIN
jgi:hypothetical protein